jgi:hypothetical protein
MVDFGAGAFSVRMGTKLAPLMAGIICAFQRMKFSRVNFSATGGRRGLRELGGEEDDAMDMT